MIPYRNSHLWRYYFVNGLILIHFRMGASTVAQRAGRTTTAPSGGAKCKGGVRARAAEAPAGRAGGANACPAMSVHSAALLSASCAPPCFRPYLKPAFISAARRTENDKSSTTPKNNSSRSSNSSRGSNSSNSSINSGSSSSSSSSSEWEEIRWAPYHVWRKRFAAAC